MSKRETLVEILKLAQEINDYGIARAAVLGLVSEYNIIVVDENSPRSLSEIPLTTVITGSTRIAAIKELREKAAQYGLPTGLKESKEEIDRRVALTNTGYSNRW